ncbi:hypothetical protein [Cyclobacterium sp. SYSU L10401]|uniref:hypothetical protein n=1 Tax=Cyclobacterium sp. SYSU L10401 TaxID=2678657 RepID=UPI0013D20DBE|nr:hypothetical protein [Cyclobacterium sp. SYSU L10401]
MSSKCNGPGNAAYFGPFYFGQSQRLKEGIILFKAEDPGIHCLHADGSRPVFEDWQA